MTENDSSSISSIARPWRRAPDWPEKLAAYVNATITQPFAWGRQDCVLWAAGAIAAMTDDDLLLVYPHWRVGSARQAAARLRSLGGLEKAVEIYAAELGLKEINPRYGQRGDLAIVAFTPAAAAAAATTTGQGRRRQQQKGKHSKLILALGVFWGGILAPGLAGLVMLPRNLARRAWRL